MLLLLGPCLALGQDWNNQRIKTIDLSTDTVQLDSLSLVPNSLELSINGQTVDTSNYQVDPIKGLLIWKPGKRPTSGQAETRYRVFPFDLDISYQHKDVRFIEPDKQGEINPFRYTSISENAGLFNLKGLDKQGSISRGVNFGNNQDLSVNSSLNLQLSGKINERMSILAAISDENIPIQPEGNTQQLQEFDRVYIQLYDDKSKLTAGDFQLDRPNSHFMNYYKRAQGGSFETRFPLQKKDTSAYNMGLKASAAVSRGKFSRQIIQGVEGNQGPYRLRGAEDETFIIIISGTERIYIDGKLLSRDQENDYIIDYNTAELTFTAKQLITKDKRIVAEFQYSDKNYARSLIQFTDEFRSKRLNLRFNVYSEQDSKNQPLQQDLDDVDRSILRNAGDSLSRAIAPGFDTVPFDENAILYALIDSVVVDTIGGGSTTYDSVFVFSKDPQTAIYSLTFTNVGFGNGNYVLDQNTANGKVYRWVAPIDGIPQGSFEPIVVLISPKQRQMVTLGGEYRISNNTKTQFEGAISNNDVNTFSDRDGDDDIGHAFKVNVDNRLPINQQSSNPWILNTSAGFERLSSDFQEIERFRTVEFDRDWNIRDVPLEGEQNISSGSIGVARDGLGGIRYGVDAFLSGAEYNAVRNRAGATIQTNGFDIVYDGSWMTSGGKARNSNFLRHKTLGTKDLKYFKLGYRDDFERNLFNDPDSDSLLGNSYRFWEWEVFAINPDTTVNLFKVNYIQRKDFAADSVELQLATFGESVGFSFDLLKNHNSKLRGRAAYRTLDVIDSNLTALTPERTLVSRLEYNLKLFKGAIVSNSFYEIGSGLEEKKEFEYIPVTPGQGVYTWRDYDGDGIQRLDEFEVAVFQDTANYIKIFTLTDDFVKVFTNQFNQSFFFRPGIVWNNKKGMRKFLSRFSDQVAFLIDRKTNEESGASRYNPFLQNIDDDNLQSLNSSFRNTFYFNRAHPKYGTDLSFQDIRNKTLLTNGFESRSNRFGGIRTRWNITKVISWVNEYQTGEKSNRSEFLTNREYQIAFFEVEPTLSFQPGTKFRLSVFYNYQEKNNREVFGGEQSVNQTVGSDIRYNSVGKGSLLMNVSLIDIDFNDDPNSPVAFELLDGLQPGQNATWSLSYQRTLANNLQLNLNYNGRQSEGVNTVHAGGVQVRAFF